MKTTLSFWSAVLSALLICAIQAGCMKNKPVSTKPTLYTLSKLVSNATNLTFLDTSLMRTGLDSFFNQNNSYTLFASTDANWIAAGLTDTFVNNVPDSQLNKIVLYGAISGSILSAQLPTGPNAAQTTVSGDSVFITNNTSGVFVNGINVSTSDVLASNGVIDALGQPLIPPAGTLLQIVQADSTFSFFSAALARTGAGQTNVNLILSSGSIYTLLLPTNDAFRMAGYLTTDSINSTDPDSLANLLTYHILPGRVFTSDFASDTTQYSQSTLLNTSPINLVVLGGVSYYVQGLGNISPIPIIRANIMAHNGVLQVIGQLLIP